MADFIGKTIGRYHILEQLGEGGMAMVFKAYDTRLEREVALKEMQDPYASNAESRARFMTEAEITGQLEHPGIVPVYGLTQDERGRPCYAMRFIEGRSLHQAIKDLHGTSEAKRTTPVDYSSLEFRHLLQRSLGHVPMSEERAGCRKAARAMARP